MWLEHEEGFTLLRRFRDNQTQLRCSTYSATFETVLLGRIVEVSENGVRFLVGDGVSSLTVAFDREPFRSFFDHTGGLADPRAGETIRIMFKQYSDDIGSGADSVSFSEVLEAK